jgi:hypothetical protein
MESALGQGCAVWLLSQGSHTAAHVLTAWTTCTCWMGQGVKTPADCVRVVALAALLTAGGASVAAAAQGTCAHIEGARHRGVCEGQDM